MKRSRFSEEQIIGILKEQEAGARTADVSRKHGVSEVTFYKWNEPRRVCRRLQVLSRMEHHEQDDEQVFP
jgi:transposase-like protein